MTRSSSPHISLPTDTPPSNHNNPFASIRDSASNVFSNVSNSVQGYLPVGLSGEEEEEPWYQMSRVEVNNNKATKFPSLFFHIW